MRKHFGNCTFFVLLLLAIILPFTEASANNPIVYKVPLQKAVTSSKHVFLQRAFKEAKEAGAEAIFIEMNTPGGAVDAAGKIANLIDTSDIEVIVYVNDDAISAGSYIALYADQIYMSPRGKMGASQVIDSAGNAADAKMDSFWIASMKSAAESSGKEDIYARAMADPSVDLPQYGAPEGKLLTLTAKEALEVGYSDGIVQNFKELLKITGFEQAKVVSVNETFTENIADFVTHPVVIPILLSIAGLGLVLELYSPGFGVPGTMAISSLLLFFYGHLIAGLAGYEAIILFIIGIILIIAEFFLPGGIAGGIGALAVIGSIIMAGANPLWMAGSVLIALAIAIIGMVIIMKFFGKKLHLLNKVVLMDATDTESGYVSNVNRVELLGKSGETLTPLRPAGTIVLDGERIDVVSEGSYIDKGKNVMIVKVEGSRVVVRESDEKGENK